MAEPRHLVVGTPCHGGLVTHLFMISVMRLEQACRERGIGFDLLLLAGDAHIGRARATVATQFMENAAATHLLFVDADIAFEPEAALRLLDFGAELSGGMYPIKTLDWERARRAAVGGEDPRVAALSYVTGFPDPAHPGMRGDFARAALLGTGFMMVRRRVFEVLTARHPELRFRSVPASPDPHAGSPHRCALFEGMIDADGTYLPEDYAFCRRWTAAGGEIWVDLASRLTHLGTYKFAGDARHMIPRPPEEAAR